MTFTQIQRGTERIETGGLSHRFYQILRPAFEIGETLIQMDTRPILILHIFSWCILLDYGLRQVHLVLVSPNQF